MNTKREYAVTQNKKNYISSAISPKTKDSMSSNSAESEGSSGRYDGRQTNHCYRKSKLSSPASGSSSGSSGRKIPTGLDISSNPWKSLEHQKLELKAPRAVTSYFKATPKESKSTKYAGMTYRCSPRNERLKRDFMIFPIDNERELNTDTTINDYTKTMSADVDENYKKSPQINDSKSPRINNKNSSRTNNSKAPHMCDTKSQHACKYYEKDTCDVIHHEKSPRGIMHREKFTINNNQIADIEILKTKTYPTMQIVNDSYQNAASTTSTFKSSKKSLPKPKKYPVNTLKNRLSKKKAKLVLNSYNKSKRESSNRASSIDVETETEEAAAPEELFAMLLNSVEQTENVNLQLQAIMTLTNAAQKAEAEIKDMIMHKVLPVLVKLLYPKDDFDDCTFAALILSSFLDACPEYCSFVITENVVEPLSILLTSGEIDTESLNNVTGLLLSLCQQNETIDAVFMQNILPKLASLLDQKDKEIVGNAMHTMLYLLKNSDEQMLILFSDEIILKFIKSLNHFDEDVKLDTIRIISHIADGSPSKLQLLIKKGDVLAHFRQLINEKTTKLRNEALWCLANITSARDNMFDEMEAADLLIGLGQNLKRDNFLTKKLSTWIISNLTFKIEKRQIEKLLQLNIVVGICKMFTLDDNQVSNFALNALRNMLEVEMNNKIVVSTIEKCGGLEKIKKIVGQGDSNISEIAGRLMSRHFPTKKSTQSGANELKATNAKITDTKANDAKSTNTKATK